MSVSEIAAPEQFECPICLYPMLLNIYKCRNGHSVCETCNMNQVVSGICPLCRDPDGMATRNTEMEDLIAVTTIFPDSLLRQYQKHERTAPDGVSEDDDCWLDEEGYSNKENDNNNTTSCVSKERDRSPIDRDVECVAVLPQNSRTCSVIRRNRSCRRRIQQQSSKGGSDVPCNNTVIVVSSDDEQEVICLD